MYTYSIMPMNEDRFDAICEDIREQYRKKISTCPLFLIKLVPEGDPVWNKADPICSLYRRYQEALAPDGIPTGILIQASLGHGYPLTPAPFQRYVNLTDGKEAFTYCPEDNRMLDYLADAVGKIAAEHPRAIMLDDDFRLVMRPGRGCACPRHMAEFNRRAGQSMTREELYAHLLSHPDHDPLARIFFEVQRDTLIHAAQVLRDAIDRVDPSIQGINCTSGDYCEAVTYTNKIFAGANNPTMVRMANGIYAPLTVRGFSTPIRNAAVRGAKLKRHGIDIVLSETDTIPFNRYGKSARYLHSHYTSSILEGAKGAKHWITRFTAHEPSSGRAFRNILALHNGMYERLASIADNLRFVGCGSLFLEQELPSFRQNVKFSIYHENEWISTVIERMGLPFYFTQENRGAAFLESDIVADMTDEQIERLFENGSVFADASAARDLVARGYGDRLGVDILPWDGSLVTGEAFDEAGHFQCQKQKDLQRISITDPDTEILSQNCVLKSNKCELLSPAVTCKKRQACALSVVFCGTPKTSFLYGEGFSFLNETRKAQLVSLLKRANALPVYYHGDNELCLRAGYLEDGTLLTCAILLGLDPMDSLSLYLEKAPTSIRLMLPSGEDTPVSFTAEGDGIFSIDVCVEPMYPVILLIQ